MASFELADKVETDANSLESLAFGYRTLGKPRESALQYERLIALNWLGAEGQEYWTLAHYELGKIYTELGDTQKSKEYYEKFLNLWKDADPDIPTLLAAKAEYAKLK
jgi:tetratricopeptide (TPR) repeat protein